MDESRLAVLAAIARIHAPGLEITAHRTTRDFAVGVLARQPHLDVVGLLRRKAHVAGAERDDAVMQAEQLEHFLSASQHALVLFFRFFRRGDRDQFHFRELMLTDHAACIAAGGAGFGAEARRAGGVAARQSAFVYDLLADEIGQRDFGGGNEPRLIANGFNFLF